MLCTVHLPASALIAAHGGTVEVQLVEVGDVQNMIGWLIAIVRITVCLITTTHSTIRLHSAQSSKFPQDIVSSRVNIVPYRDSMCRVRL